MKGQKGITLVALIITIVVLLILATVAITAIGETNIINYAENAGTSYNSSVEGENTNLQTYENYLNKYSK